MTRVGGTPLHFERCYLSHLGAPSPPSCILLKILHAILVEEIHRTLDTFWEGFHMNEWEGGGTLYRLGFIL